VRSTLGHAGGVLRSKARGRRLFHTLVFIVGDGSARRSVRPRLFLSASLPLGLAGRLPGCPIIIDDRRPREWAVAGKSTNERVPYRGTARMNAREASEQLDSAL